MSHEVDYSILRKWGMKLTYSSELQNTGSLAVLTVLVPMVEMGVVGLTVVSIVDVTVNS